MAIRVLIVDDSALMRQMLSEILNADPDIEVVDTASDPLIAREKIKKHNPDVLTLDVEMPRMNGIEFLCRIMALRPMPVIMVSSLTQEGSDTTLRALQLGAVDFIAKPAGFIGNGLADMAGSICEKVKAAARMRVTPSLSASPAKPHVSGTFADRVIAIGASTGGVPAIAAVLENLPDHMPPILIAQHMPPGFTKRFAARLNEQMEITVIEAEDGMIIKAGHAYIAPGGFQMRLGAGRRLTVKDEGRINGFCPCVDVMMESVSKVEKAKSVGVILTGMGHDGAEGMCSIRRAGGDTLGQDETSSLIYGMPRVAWEIGGVARQLPLDRLGSALISACSQKEINNRVQSQTQFTHP